MPVNGAIPSEYKAMWLFAMFDLPVTTKKSRKAYTEFRNLLLMEGFQMLQFSVYARYCQSEDASKSLKSKIKKALPARGQVRVMTITDKQFGKMTNYVGRNVVNVESEPEQMMLF